MSRNQLTQQEFFFPEKIDECFACKEITGLVWSPTQSLADGAAPGWWLCEYCAKDNEDYWEEMWDNYYSGLM